MAQSAIKSGVGINQLFKNKTPLVPVPDSEPEVEPAGAAEVTETVEIAEETLTASIETEVDPLEVLDRIGSSPTASTPAARRPKRRSSAAGPSVRVDINLPSSVAARAKDLSRPDSTGAERTLGAKFVIQAYVRAIDELGLDIDFDGIESGMETEAVVRVRAALDQWARS
jgi:hypothetical protein